MEKNWINPEIFNLLDKKSPDFLINSNKDSVDYLKKYIDKSKNSFKLNFLFYVSACTDFRTLVYFTQDHLEHLKSINGVDLIKPDYFIFTGLDEKVRALRENLKNKEKHCVFNDNITKITFENYTELTFIDFLKNSQINPNYINTNIVPLCPVNESIAFACDAIIEGTNSKKEQYYEVQKVIYFEYENIAIFEKIILENKINVIYFCALREGLAWGNCGKSIVEWLYNDNINNKEIHNFFKPKFLILDTSYHGDQLFEASNIKYDLGYEKSKYFNFPREVFDGDDLLDKNRELRSSNASLYILKQKYEIIRF